jgi:ubiquinone/menaquinone biosynthesis C-methylase UbiE
MSAQQPLSTTLHTWNQLAQLYAESFMELDSYQHTYAWLVEALGPKPMDVLDVGCGPGILAHYFQQHAPQWRLLGIDGAPQMIAEARVRFPLCQWRVLQAHQLDALKIPFSLITVGFCIPYMSPDELAVFWSKAYQALLPEGYLYVSFVVGHADQSGWIAGAYGRMYFHYHPEAWMLQQARQVGLRWVQSWDVPYSRNRPQPEIHRVWVLQKKA